MVSGNHVAWEVAWKVFCGSVGIQRSSVDVGFGGGSVASRGSSVVFSLSSSVAIRLLNKVHCLQVPFREILTNLTKAGLGFPEVMHCSHASLPSSSFIQ